MAVYPGNMPLYFHLLMCLKSQDDLSREYALIFNLFLCLKKLQKAPRIGEKKISPAAINRNFTEDRQSTQRFWHINQLFGCFCEIIIWYFQRNY